jgi:hypothetical protein
VLTALGTLMHAEWYVTPDARATAVRARHAMRSDTSSFNHITVERMQEATPCESMSVLTVSPICIESIGSTHLYILLDLLVLASCSSGRLRVLPVGSHAPLRCLARRSVRSP